jgi:hypothetical protein
VQRARKTIENKAIAHIRTSQPLLDHGVGDFIRHKFAAIHVRSGQLSQMRLLI